MFDKEMADKLDKHLRDKLDILYEFDFNGLLLLMGGAVKGLIMDTKIKDYDFVLLTQDKDNILEFINKYDLKYKINPGHGYTIFYNNVLIGISSTNDLCYVGNYSTDFLFYDIYRKQFIPIGIKRAILKRQVEVLEYIGFPRVEKRLALKKRLDFAEEFIRFMNGDNKKVKVIKRNKYYRRLFLGFLRNPSKIKKLFRR